MGHRIRKTQAIHFFVLMLLGVGKLFPLDSALLVPSVTPGTHGSPQLVSFQKPAGMRYATSLDGAPFAGDENPILLTAPNGAERDFVIETEMRSLLPDSPVIAKQRFLYRIDLKAPASLRFSVTPAEGGMNVAITLSEDGVIEYQLYHPFSASFGSASISPGETLYLPDGSSLCASALDAAGNRGPSASLAIDQIEEGKLPLKVINPVPGNWANAQVLLVESMPGTEIRYSLDGSDPSGTGLAYEGPVLLNSEGITTLRIWGVSASGTQYADRILYTVQPRSAPEELKFSPSGLFVETGEFGEIYIPPLFTYGFDDPIAATEGDKSIVFSAVRGTRLYFPLTVSDGTSLWRWICASGEKEFEGQVGQTPVASEEAPIMANNGASAPTVIIHDWYFLELRFAHTVYYSKDGKNWTLYDGMVFFDRLTDKTFYWYSPDWKESAIQKEILPAKPKFGGIPDSLLSSDPVLLTMFDSPFTFRYEVGTIFMPSVPREESPEFSSGFLVEVPSGAVSPFFVRLVAMYGGLVHGELFARFVIDRKPPRTPSPVLNPDSAYSRFPVTLTPTGEEKIHVSISPSLYTVEGKRFILNGDEKRPVEYAISLYAIDDAGNKSSVVERTVTVDLNALYVDSAWKGTAERNGMPSSPFASLDDALSAVRGKDAWRIYLKGPASLARSYTIQTRVSITGDDALITAGAGASIAVSGGSLSMSDCVIRADYPKGESATKSKYSSGSLPSLFTIQNGDFFSDNIEVFSSGLSSSTILRASGARITCVNSRFELSASEYALLFDIADSTVRIAGCTYLATADNASICSIVSSDADISDTAFSVSPLIAGCALESWGSTLTLKKIEFDRLPSDVKNKDTAFWFDGRTTLLSVSDVRMSGFFRYMPASTP